jgi:hypothetical protein
MMKTRKKTPPFNDLCDIPIDPKRVLTRKPETPGEIAKRTGLHFGRLCDKLVEWFESGKVKHGFIGTPGFCQVPVFWIEK